METTWELPPRLRQAQDHLDEALLGVAEQVTVRAREAHPDLELLAGEIGRFVAAGGKRLRPLLVLLGYGAAGGDADVTGPALAVELVHTCALIHDDLIDRSATRRGEPTSHHAFAALAGSWAGDPEGFGSAASILAGDLAHVLADALFLDCVVASEQLLEAFRSFITMREEVTGGQFLDVLSQHRGDTSVDLALTIAERKSGRYSVARPLQIGALLAGGRELADGLVRFGIPLGVAFQLRDDVLGVFGSEQATGKSVVSDLVEGKRTYLVAATLERLSPQRSVRFQSLLGRSDLEGDEADELRDAMRRSGGLDATERRAEELLEEALTALGSLALPSEVRDDLRSLAGFLVNRRA